MAERGIGTMLSSPPPAAPTPFSSMLSEQSIDNHDGGDAAPRPNPWPTSQWQEASTSASALQGNAVGQQVAPTAPMPVHQHQVPFRSAPVQGSPSPLGFGFGIGSSLGGNNNSSASSSRASAISTPRMTSSPLPSASTAQLLPFPFLHRAPAPPPRPTPPPVPNERKRRVSSSSSSSSHTGASSDDAAADARSHRTLSSLKKRLRRIGEYTGQRIASPSATASPLSPRGKQPLPERMRTGFLIGVQAPRSASAQGSGAGSLGLMDDLRNSLPASSSSTQRPGKRALSPLPSHQSAGRDGSARRAAADAQQPGFMRRKTHTSEQDRAARRRLERQLDLVLSTSAPSISHGLLRKILHIDDDGESDDEQEQEQERALTKRELQRLMMCELLQRIAAGGGSADDRDGQGTVLQTELVVRMIRDKVQHVQNALPQMHSSIRAEYVWSRARPLLTDFAQLVLDLLPFYTPGGVEHMLADLRGQPAVSRAAQRNLGHNRATDMLAFMRAAIGGVIMIASSLIPVPASSGSFATQSRNLAASAFGTVFNESTAFASKCIDTGKRNAGIALAGSAATSDPILDSLLGPMLQALRQFDAAICEQAVSSSAMRVLSISAAQSESGSDRAGASSWQAELQALAQQASAPAAAAEARLALQADTQDWDTPRAVIAAIQEALRQLM